jgi:hypothetical protein
VSLEKEAQVSEKLIASLKEELSSLLRLKALHEEEAARLRAAISSLEQENSLLRETVAKQDTIIIKQNEDKKSLKKVAKILFGVGLAIGIGGGLYLGGKR